MNQMCYLALNSGFGGCQIVLIHVLGGCQLVLIRLKLGVSAIQRLLNILKHIELNAIKKFNKLKINCQVNYCNRLIEARIYTSNAIYENKKRMVGPRAGERGPQQMRRRDRMESIPGNFNVHLAAIEAPGCRQARRPGL